MPDELAAKEGSDGFEKQKPVPKCFGTGLQTENCCLQLTTPFFDVQSRRLEFSK